MVSFGQNKSKEFNSSSEYLKYVNKKFNISSSEIFYLSTETDSLDGALEKVGMLLFITDNKIATVEEVANILKSQCAPQNMPPRVTEDAILKASTQSKVFEKMIIKNLESGYLLSHQNGKFGIYLFSIKFGKNAKMYYNEREELEKLGYKSIVISMDGAYINNIPDIDKTPIYVN